MRVTSADRGAGSLNLKKKTRISKITIDGEYTNTNDNEFVIIATMSFLSVTKQETQLSLTNRATYLCVS